MADWRDWVITDEQKKKILCGDCAARNAFYFDNLPRIKRMAYAYARTHSYFRGLVDDLINGVYVDLTVFQSEYNCPVKDRKSLCIGLSALVASAGLRISAKTTRKCFAAVVISRIFLPSMSLAGWV